MNSIATTIAFAVGVQRPSGQLNVRRLAHDLLLIFPGSEIEEVVQAIEIEIIKQRVSAT